MPQLLNTVFDLPAPLARTLTRGSHEPQSITPDVRPEVQISDREAQPEIAPANASDEFKLPKLTSLIIVLLASALLQVSFFIVVSSSNEYAKHLGGTSTFSGLVIGIPTVFSGLALVPLAKLDGGGYKRPLHFACASALLGNVLYSLAYYANFLYLILIGRIVSGFGFTFWMYSKRYCSDPRIVGVRRRTMLAGWLVLGQGVGFSVGPFVGGLLYKVGFSNAVFNGYTSPTWVLSALWAVFWLVAALLYEDVPPKPPAGTQVELQSASPSRNRQQTLRNKSSRDITSEGIVVPHEETPPSSTEIIVAAPSDDMNTDTVQPTPMRMSAAQWGVTATMCWFAMTCFFILGAWEANIPVFTESNLRVNPFHFSPSAAGNLIALGGICTIPFLLVNLVAARRVQDRHTLAVGSGLGLVGLLIAIGILRGNAVNYGSLFICWFLVALGFNLASTVTLSLLSKQLPGEWNMRISMAIQYSNYTGRVCGAVWGGAGTKVGMLSYVGLQIALVGIGAVMFSTLWKQLKAKTG
ncbi:MFS general substrate transporter [Laetiporus sulphureus 93-53]|uniref:MFS general substrate transporter n=1 Tax=Laetiporus sulphureus 93-53 TaxID=1314785 RepID=A0A165BYQ6_9APHY|nr:MFS general substrate transporter [Laetiporus sulphureus 93-53]KZT01892.1 MFS general substrate transporter [Laetiporus sulphureus 93-53]